MLLYRACKTRYNEKMSVSLRVPLLILCLFQAQAGEAASVGSPSSVLRKGQWVMGLKASGLSRDVTKSDLHAKAEFVGGSHFRGYGLTDWLSAYVGIGGAYFRVKGNAASDSFGANLAIDGQLKSRLWESERYGVEWDASAQYLYLGAPHRKKNNQGHWSEWQLASSVAKSFGPLTPYVGAKFSFVDLAFKIRKDNRITQQGTYKQDNIVSPFIGLDWYVGAAESLIVNVEGSFVNGAEADLSVAYRF